jgi:hypothetical protein
MSVPLTMHTPCFAESARDSSEGRSVHLGELLALAIGSDEASSTALNIQGEDTARATALVLCVCLVMCTFMRDVCVRASVCA